MHDLAHLIKGCQARVYTPAGTHSICREHFLGYLTWPTLLMSASAAIADPLLRRAFASGLAPRTLNVLHEYASSPHGSTCWSRGTAQRFRDEPA